MTSNDLLSNEQLEYIRDQGAAIYLSAYLRLMCNHMGIETTQTAIKDMALEMLEPLNHANEAIWRALMSDKDWTTALERLRTNLQRLAQGATHDPTHH